MPEPAPAEALLTRLEPHIDWGACEAASDYFARGEYLRESLTEFLAQILSAGFTLTRVEGSSHGA